MILPHRQAIHFVPVNLESASAATKKLKQNTEKSLDLIAMWLY